jgi:hypothetical protein
LAAARQVVRLRPREELFVCVEALRIEGLNHVA